MAAIDVPTCLAAVGGTALLLSRSGVAEYLRPAHRRVEVVPAASLEEELADPARDLEARGFQRFGAQVERRPLTVWTQSRWHCFALPDEGIYANLAPATMRDVPLVYFFSTFEDGGWVWTSNADLPDGAGWRDRPGRELLGYLLWSADASRRSSVDLGSVVPSHRGGGKSWVGRDFVATALPKVSWSETSEVIEVHRRALKEAGTNRKLMRAEPTSAARLEAARCYHRHPTRAYLTRVEARSAAETAIYGALFVGGSVLAAAISAARPPATKPSSDAAMRYPARPIRLPIPPSATNGGR